MAGNGEATDPKTLDQIAKSVWDDVMGEDSEVIDSGIEYLEEKSVKQAEPPVEEKKPAEEEPPVVEDDGTETTVETDQTAGKETEDTSSQAPEHWSAEDRKMFDGLDDEAKDFLLRRHRQMEGDYTRKTQENAAAIKVGRLLDEAMDPAVKADLRRIGVDNESYIRQMLQWHHMSVADPAGFARNVVRQLRLDPAQVFGEGWEGPEQEQLDPVSQRMAVIEQRINQDQLERHNQAVQQTQARVDAFRDEKDAGGNLLHPHFETVRKDMAQFLRVDPNMSLEDSYQASVYKNPELRAKIVNGQQVPSATERAKQALRAKNSNIKGSGGTQIERPVDKRGMSLEQSLKAAADEVGFDN